MLIRKVSEQELNKAMDAVNKKYNGNVTWNNFVKDGSGYRVTLKVLDSKKPGHRLHRSYGFNGLHSERRSRSACWHVHGDFFDALFDINPNVTIRTGKDVMRSKADNWQDRNIGSNMFPVYFSESCEC